MATPMDRTGLDPGRHSVAPLVRSLSGLALAGRSLPVTIAALLVLTVMLVAARRISGALAQPASSGMLAAAGLAAVMGALAAVGAARSYLQVPVARRALLFATGGLSCGWALALSMPRSPGWGLAGLWLFTAVAVAICVAEAAGRGLVLPGHWLQGNGLQRPRTRIGRRPATWPKHSSRPAQPKSADCELSQTWRLKTADGVELVKGWLRVELAAGQRLAVAHIGFCPPLATIPQVEITADSASSARVRVTQVLHGGARLEVKRTEPSQGEWVRVRFEARAPLPDATGERE